MGLGVWLGLVLVLYALSTGPVYVVWRYTPMIPFGSPAQKVATAIYRPVDWAATRTPLRKPLYMYWHLWGVDFFDSHGIPLWK